MFIYVGDGGFLNGVPARDLGPADLEALSEAQRDAVAGCGLYQYVDRGERVPGTDPVPTEGSVELPELPELPRRSRRLA